MTPHDIVLPFARSVSIRHLGAFLFFAFMLITSREPPWADAHVTYDTTKQLIEEGQLDVRIEGGSPWFYAIRNGRKYGVFPLGNVIGMVPSYLAYKVFKHVPGVTDSLAYVFTAHLAPALWMTFACLLLFDLARRRSRTETAALALTLVTAFATIIVIYARATYSEALQTLVVLWVVERTFTVGERPSIANVGWLGVAAGVLINTKLVNVLLLPSVVIFVLWRRASAKGEDRATWGGPLRLLARAPAALIALGVFVAVALVHNQIKTGSYWSSGYQIREGIFSGDLFAGLYGLLFSTGKSAFLYSPPLLLAILGVRTVWRERAAEALFLLSLMAISLIYNAKFRHWHADYCWGPRHIVSLVPLAMLLALPIFEAADRGELRAKILVAATTAAGLFVQFLGAAFYWDHYIRILIAIKDQAGAPGWFTENLTHGHYIPGFSPLAGHWWIFKSLALRDPNPLASAPWLHVVPQGFKLDETFGRARPDWWVLDWFAEHTGAPIWGVALLLLLIAATVITARRVYRYRRPIP